MRPASLLFLALLGGVLPLAGQGLLLAADTTEADGTEAAGAEAELAVLPPGPGREEVYYQCQPCHSLAIVKQQRLSRDSWEETLHWMVEEQDMAPLETEEREIILTYLATHFGVDHRPRHVQNAPGADRR